MNTSSPGTLLPVPANFPVEWDTEEQQRLLWRWDNIHSPLPATPMSASMGEARQKLTAAQSGDQVRRPSQSNRRRINGYSYSANVVEPLSDEQRAAKEKADDEAISTTRKRWDDELLPTLEKDLAYMRSLDLTSASDQKMLGYLEEYQEFQVTHWRFHSLAISPLSLAVERMAKLYREIMGDVPDAEPYLLLQGIDNKSLETDRAIQKLADIVRGNQTLSALFSAQVPSTELTNQLGDSLEGLVFLRALDDFLEIYGYRPTGFDMLFPAWIEDPSFVLLNIKAYLAQTPRDLDAEQKSLLDEGQRLLDDVKERTGGDDRLRERFCESLDRAKELWPLKEDHAFYIDQGSTAMVRILIAEMGRRLCRRGVIESSEDVFYLLLDELVESMSSDDPAIKLRQAVVERRAEWERCMKLTPPPFLGTMPTEGTTTMQPEFQRMMAPVTAAQPDGGDTVLRGVAGSRGTATAIARIVRSPQEFDKVQPGDILVCTSTSPTWTPLFGSISGLVSDSGGVLSHTAIVAREYGLPAVVGVTYGTSLISDGQIITVDGDAGVVLLR